MPSRARSWSSASRMSGLKSVSPELLTITSTHAASRCRTSGASPRPGLAHVAVDHFDLLAQKFGEPLAVRLRQRFEYRRFFDHALKSLAAEVDVAVMPHQQINAADLRQIRQQVCQPHFADEARRADQQNVFSAQRIAHGQAVFAVAPKSKCTTGLVTFGLGRSAGLNRFFQNCRVLLESKNAKLAFRGPAGRPAVHQ